LRYVEGLKDARTKLAGFSSSLPLGPFPSFEIPQPNLDCFPCYFCPTNLRICGKDLCRLGVLNLQAENFNDAVIDLHICHGYPPSGKVKAEVKVERGKSDLRST
jgi:hypothetical protein